MLHLEANDLEVKQLSQQLEGTLFFGFGSF